LIDSHSHLGLCEPDASELVRAAREAGVDRVLTVGLGPDSNPGAIELARAHAEVFACVGRHPNSAEGFGEEDERELERLAADDAVVAVGETGIDLYREGAPLEDQRRAFAGQIRVARSAGKPIVIHLRDREGSEDAVTEAFETLERDADGVEVILHCFSATAEWAERAAERRWYCSFAGNVTYPSAEALRQAAAVVPEDRILVETDAPFLSPQPVRGRPNQPANVVATAERLAAVRGVSYEALERSIEDNAARVFGWDARA
jgi:TatD DNase family protein